MSIPKAGDIIDDRYEVLELLGEGGMGTVLKAREIGLERIVAVKLLHAGLIGNEDDRKRFYREGKVLASLSHPNILRFFRFGMAKSTLPYIAMQYVEGAALRQFINTEGGIIAWQRCLELGIQICNAMGAAHSHGIIHRDLTPSNVMLTTEGGEEQAKIVDFGLARVISGEGEKSQHLTQTGTLIGSIYYMSPEQCSGKMVDGRSDIYSLGCVLYEAMVGEPPLQADSAMGLVHKHLSDRPRNIEEFGDFPVGLGSVLFRAMAKSCESRYQSMAEFAADLELVREGRGAEVTPEFEPAPPEKITTRLAIAAIAVFIAVALVGACVICFGSKPDNLPRSVGTSVRQPLKERVAGMTLIGQRLRARSDVGTLPRLERIEYYTRWLEKYDSCSKIQASAFARVWLSKDLLSRSPGPAPLYRNFRRERRATIEARNADRELLQSAIPLSREALAQLIKLEDGIISKTKDRQEDLRLALDGIAECCYQLNAMDTLELQVRKCLKSLLQTSDPDQRVYLVFCRELAGTYMARLKYDQALQILEKVCSETAAGPASNTDRNGMIVDCSICLQKLGKIAQARARLTDLCKTTTEWTPWSEELTEQLVALGDLTEALKVAHLMEFDSGQLPGYSFGKAVQLQVGILELRGEPGEACDLCMKAINGAAEPRYSARLARADIPVLLALAANISSRNNNVRRMQIEKLVIEQIHRSGTDSSETIVLKKTLDELEAAKFKL